MLFIFGFVGILSHSVKGRLFHHRSICIKLFGWLKWVLLLLRLLRLRRKTGLEFDSVDVILFVDHTLLHLFLRRRLLWSYTRLYGSN